MEGWTPLPVEDIRLHEVQYDTKDLGYPAGGKYKHLITITGKVNDLKSLEQWCYRTWTTGYRVYAPNVNPVKRPWERGTVLIYCDLPHVIQFKTIWHGADSQSS